MLYCLVLCKLLYAGKNVLRGKLLMHPLLVHADYMQNIMKQCSALLFENL
jgi:hypothetical protein